MLTFNQYTFSKWHIALDVVLDNSGSYIFMYDKWNDCTYAASYEFDTGTPYNVLVSLSSKYHPVLLLERPFSNDKSI